MSQSNKSNSSPHYLALLVVIAGLALTSLLPIGMLGRAGINSKSFDYLFIAHLVLLLIAVFSTLVSIGKLCFTGGTIGQIIYIISLLIFGLAIAEGSLPVTVNDALIHHLAVPKLWLESGSISEIPWNSWSYYPMLINLGFLGLMKHSYSAWCSAYHALYLILLAGVVVEFMRRFNFKALHCALAFLLTISLPINLKLASMPVVDLGLALYFGLGLLLLVEWLEDPSQRGLIILAGASLGLALGCKYNAILGMAVALPLFFVSGLAVGLGLWRMMWVAASAGFIALLAFAPWALKNMLWQGNPLYPLYKSAFGADVQAPLISSPKPLMHRVLIHGESIYDILLLPLRMIFLGRDGSAQYFDGVLSPLLILILLSLWLIRKHQWVRFNLVFTLAYFSFAVVMAQARVRYMAPIFASSIILTLAGVESLENILKSIKRVYIVALLAFVQVMFALGYSRQRAHATQFWEYARGDLSRQQYLEAQIAEFPIIEWANANLPQDACIYLLYTGNQFYYYDRQVRSNGHYSGNQLLRWISDVHDARALAREFTVSGVNYLLAHADRTRDAIESYFRSRDMPEKLGIWNSFQSRFLESVYESRGFGIWKIHPEPISFEIAGQDDMPEDTGDQIQDQSRQ